MPYLEFMYCDKCKVAPLDIDYKKTVESYCTDGRCQKDAFINPAMIVWDYLVYTCTYCGHSEKYNFREVELKVRERLAQQSEEFREYFERVGNVDFLDTKPQSLKPRPRKEAEERIRNTYASKD